jgi:hypothetical protein
MKALLCGAVCALALGAAGTAGAATIYRTDTVDVSSLSVNYGKSPWPIDVSGVAHTPEIVMGPQDVMLLTLTFSAPLPIEDGVFLTPTMTRGGDDWAVYFFDTAYTEPGNMTGGLVDIYNSGSDFVTPWAIPFSFVGTPEPASWALMLAGIGLTGALLRRRMGRARNEHAAVVP